MLDQAIDDCKPHRELSVLLPEPAQGTEGKQITAISRNFCTGLSLARLKNLCCFKYKCEKTLGGFHRELCKCIKIATSESILILTFSPVLVKTEIPEMCPISLNQELAFLLFVRGCVSWHNEAGHLSIKMTPNTLERTYNKFSLFTTNI